MSTRTRSPARQRGVALISSILLLIIITILALSLFRSFGTQEKIAGNLREKERALHAADSTLQYAESWLLQGNNTAVGAGPCPAGTLDANLGQGQICNQSPQQAGWAVTTVGSQPGQTGWTSQAGASQVIFRPPGMSFTQNVNGASNDPPYFAIPGFYIADVGLAADGAGEAYQIDAYGYGGAAGAVAVVESTYEVQQGVVCRSCP
jgi:type IV pilus assembly protein PilX